jgi:RNA polymerase sigma-70 factor (ECF subfamily)
MHTTPASLLVRLRDPGQSAEAWARFVDLYGPILFSWARRRLREEDARDVVQDIYLRLLEKLPEFTYEPGKRFRGWLYTITRHCLSDRLRRLGRLPAGGPVGLENVQGPDLLGELDEDEYLRALARRALQLMQADFEPTTWQACWQLVVEGKTGAAVAAELGVSENAVYLARSRVLRRLRQELAGLFD